MGSSFEMMELRQLFAIKIDLRAAKTQADIDFHVTELETMQMHTASNRIRRECRVTLSAYKDPIAAIHA